MRIAQATRLAEAGVDTIAMNDDIGSQKGMILSPAMWRRWLKPRVAALIAAVRRVNPQIYFRYHSDGNYVPVIPDLIEIGVSVLTTVQPEAMDVYEIKRRFGRDVALDGTIGLQSELTARHARRGARQGQGAVRGADARRRLDRLAGQRRHAGRAVGQPGRHVRGAGRV